MKIGKKDIVTYLKRFLSNTNNTSTPGEDRISYKLLKTLQNSRLGQHIFDSLADFLRGKRLILSSTGDGRDMTIVMIPKRGKDIMTVKAWRLIVLISCLTKLMDKVVAKLLQQLHMFHPGQFRSKKGKSAMDRVIQATTET